MIHTIRCCTLLVFLLAPARITSAASEKSFAVPGHAELRLLVPDGWKHELDKPSAANLPDTVRFSDDAKSFELLMTILPKPAGATDFNSPQKLLAIAQAQGTRMLATARETKLELEEVKGKSARGYIFTLSDKAPAPGSYEYVTGGVVGVGDLILSVTMLHDKAAAPRKAALDMLAGAAQREGAPATTPSSAPAATQASTLRIALPGSTWQLALDAAGLNVVEDETSPEKHARRVMAADSQRGISVSVFLEPAVTLGDAKTVRQFFFERLKRSPMVMREEEFSDGPAGSARADYFVPNFGQRHTNLYFAQEGVWIDVHLSVDQAAGDNVSAMEAITKSVRIEPKKK